MSPSFVATMGAVHKIFGHLLVIAYALGRVWSYMDHVICFVQWNVGIRTKQILQGPVHSNKECPTVCLSATVTTTSAGAASSSWVPRENPADENPQIAHDQHATRNKL